MAVVCLLKLGLLLAGKQKTACRVVCLNNKINETDNKKKLEKVETIERNSVLPQHLFAVKDLEI
jgi:hypothetical protein